MNMEWTWKWIICYLLFKYWHKIAFHFIYSYYRNVPSSTNAICIHNASSFMLTKKDSPKKGYHISVTD